MEDVKFIKNKQKMKTYEVVSLILLIVFSLYTLAPLYILLMNSFKGQADIINSPLAIPSSLDWSYLSNAFTEMHYFRSIGITIIVTFFAISLIILLSSFAGWMLARNKQKKSSKFIYMLFIAAMLIPFQAVMYPLVNIFDTMHLKNIPGLIIMYGGFGLSLSVFLYYGFLQSVPREIEEAALIDGANVFQIFRYVTFPQVKGTTATVIILNLMWIWNDYLLPYMVIGNGEYKTLTLAVYFAKMNAAAYTSPWTFIFPSVLLSIIPIVIVFFALQKQFVEGVSQGAVKG